MFIHSIYKYFLIHALLISFKLRPQPSYRYTKLYKSWIQDSNGKFTYSAFIIRQRMRAGNCLIFRGYLEWYTEQTYLVQKTDHNTQVLDYFIYNIYGAITFFPNFYNISYMLKRKKHLVNQNLHFRGKETTYEQG